MTDTVTLHFTRDTRWSAASTFRSLLYQPEKNADLSRKGVVLAAPARAELLKGVAFRFLAGYNAMLEPAPLDRLEATLAETATERHGFVVEGAAMGAAIRDALSWRGGLLDALIESYSARYEYLLAVGAGWAMARTPWRARRIQASFDPLLGSLACDGRGFHDLYFRPQRASSGQIRRYRGTRAQAYDSGIGRALWFVASGHVPRVIDLLDRFAAPRRADLLAGVGLAMAYAGAAEPADWAELRATHGQDWTHVGQGICFAAEAMRKGGIIAKTTQIACGSALGLGAEDAADLAASTRPSGVPPAQAAQAYESWRSEIRDKLRQRGAG